MTTPNILDKKDSFKPTSKYTLLAFKTIIIAILICGVLVLAGNFATHTNDNIFYLVLVLIGTLLITAVLAPIFSILSYIKNEPNSALKILSLIGSIFIFFILLGMFGFIFMDLTSIWREK